MGFIHGTIAESVILAHVLTIPSDRAFEKARTSRQAEEKEIIIGPLLTTFNHRDGQDNEQGTYPDKD